jgi:hypothetical protein
VLGIVAVRVRLRRSRGVERQQLKWVLAVTSAVGVVIVLDMGTWFIWPEGHLQERMAVMGVAFAAIPVAAGIAILRYRLYDIDLLINRALVYGALSGSLLALYGGSVLALSALLHSFTGSSDFAVAGSTLAVVALFQPVRRRIQSAVDRRFYRRKYDAARTLDGFAVRLRDEIDLDALRTELIGAVGATVQPTHASLWLRDTR